MKSTFFTYLGALLATFFFLGVFKIMDTSILSIVLWAVGSILCFMIAYYLRRKLTLQIESLISKVAEVEKELEEVKHNLRAHDSILTDTAHVLNTIHND